MNYFPFHSSFSLVALDLERRLYSPVVRGEPGGAGDPLQANQAKVGQSDLREKAFFFPPFADVIFIFSSHLPWLFLAVPEVETVEAAAGLGAAGELKEGNQC